MIPFLGIFNRTADEDPLKVFNFIVEIDGFARFGFAKCSELTMTAEPIKYREGGNNLIAAVSPGLVTPADITLERGQIIATGFGDDDFMNWFRLVFDVSMKKSSASKKFRKSPEIVQNDREGKEAIRWRVHNAWPTVYTPFSALEALTSANSMQKMVLANEGWSRV